jgi:hypothetical protein
VPPLEVRQAQAQLFLKMKIIAGLFVGVSLLIKEFLGTLNDFYSLILREI